MPTSFGEPLTKLRAMPTRENGEPLVDPRTLSKRIHFAAKHPKFEDMPRTPKVRKRVAEMLAEAAEALPPGIDLRIVEGFRPLEQQRFMYESLGEEMRKKHPEWNKATLHRQLNRLSAPPDDSSPPPHSTGAAVDLCLFDTTAGEIVDTFGPQGWGEGTAPTEVKGLPEEARANRRLLIETLSATGLTNYAGEWWHWSYGDQGWALRTGAGAAIYGPLTND